MMLQTRRLCETFVAKLACKRLLTSVQPHVRTQPGLPVETLSTELACESAFETLPVLHLVDVQAIFRLETHATNVARNQLLRFVGRFVTCQPPDETEPHPTVTTQVLFIITLMYSIHVDLEETVLDEVFVAFHTFAHPQWHPDDVAISLRQYSTHLLH